MYHPHRASPPQHQSSPIPAFNLDDDDFDPLWGFASQPSQYTEGPSEPVEDNSPVEEVVAVKLKRKYARRRQPIKKDDKEFVELWTPEEEVSLCKSWVHASENSVEGNGKKATGFWMEVTTGEQKRSYDSVNYKWKNRIHPKVSQFCEIYNSVKDRHQSGACDNTIYQEAEIEYRTIYCSAFALTKCSSDLAHIGVDLNDEATDSEDVKVQEVRPMGRNRAKKKGSSSGTRSESSVACDPSLVDALHELELEDQRRREQGELERLKIAQRDKELELQQKMFEFQQQQKFEEDIKYYNETHEHLTRRTLYAALLLEKKSRSVGI
ncbi:hypothetical protein Tco_0726706 [Tanacetum coccineum]|uniref:Myb-like domain-containing protein n=1 Tax=Tanacetum coccineum TaxID=301880 RepID=A0ABQ4YIM3_9ASTR